MSIAVSIFISHSWKYSQHYQKLSEWIFDESWSVEGVPIRFVDQSIPKENPIHNAPSTAALRDEIFARIRVSEIAVIPMGMYAEYSKWIQNEIDGCVLYGVPILAVNPWGQERKSSVVRDSADRECNWNKKSVVDSIWKLKNSRLV